MQSLEAKCAVYARVSTSSQEVENQLLELRIYGERRGWRLELYIDKGVSGSQTSRPELDRLMKDARRRRFDVLLCWRLDRLGRNLRHLVLLLDELEALGIQFVSLGEGIDTTTPAGRLQMHILGAIAEFERARLGERVRAGLARARAQGLRLGRPRAVVPTHRVEDVAALSVNEGPTNWASHAPPSSGGEGRSNKPPLSLAHFRPRSGQKVPLFEPRPRVQQTVDCWTRVPRLNQAGIASESKRCFPQRNGFWRQHLGEIHSPRGSAGFRELHTPLATVLTLGVAQPLAR